MWCSVGPTLVENFAVTSGTWKRGGGKTQATQLYFVHNMDKITIMCSTWSLQKCFTNLHHPHARANTSGFKNTIKLQLCQKGVTATAPKKTQDFFCFGYFFVVFFFAYQKTYRDSSNHPQKLPSSPVVRIKMSYACGIYKPVNITNNHYSLLSFFCLFVFLFMYGTW